MTGRALLAAAIALATAAPAPAAPQHRVSGAEPDPAVAAIAGGSLGFVTVWSTVGERPRPGPVYGRLLDAGGRPLGPIRRLAHVRGIPNRGAGEVVIAYNAASARYLVLWDTDVGGRIYARILDERGRPAGPARRFAPTERYAGVSSVIAQPHAGGFIVAYTALGPLDRLMPSTVIVTAAGRRVGRPARLAPADCARCGLPRLVASGGGGLAELWSTTPAGDNDGVIVRAVDARGRPVGPAPVVVSGGGNVAVVIAAAHGRALVARERSDRDAQGLSHFAFETRLVSATGPIGPVHGFEAVDDPLVLPSPGGWSLLGVAAPGALDTIPLSPDGAPAGPPIPISTAQSRVNVSRPAVALSPRHGAVAVWRRWVLHEGAPIELYAAAVPGA
jgi:hypothetical protein